jgi:hypothetical protein
MSSELADQNIGTTAVSDRQKFDIGALESWMRQHVDGFSGPLTVEQFKGGQSNPTFRLTTPSRRYVMRSKPGPVAKLLPSAHAIEREFKVQRALAATDVPVARMFGRAKTNRSSAGPSTSWIASMAGCSGSSRCRAWPTQNAQPSMTR